MALFEGYERRIEHITEVLKEYGIESIEEAKKICDEHNVDAYNITKEFNQYVLKMHAGHM